MSGVVQALQKEQTVPDLSCLFLQSMEFPCRIMQLHRPDAEQKSVLRKHNRVIYSFMETEEESIMLQSILEMDRWYMQVHQRPESRFPIAVIEIRYVLYAFWIKFLFTSQNNCVIVCRHEFLSPYSVNGHSDLLLSMMHISGDYKIRRTNTC